MIDTINTICKDIAPDLGLPESLVRKVYATYWKSVKTSIASGQHSSVWLRGLGTLAVSRTKVNKLIRKLIWRVRDLKNNREPFPRKTREQMMIESMNDLRLMCARRNEIAIAYKANDDRIKAKNATKNKGRVGVQAPDTTGDSEQAILSPQEAGARTAGGM